MGEVSESAILLRVGVTIVVMLHYRTSSWHIECVPLDVQKGPYSTDSICPSSSVYCIVIHGNASTVSMYYWAREIAIPVVMLCLATRPSSIR